MNKNLTEVVLILDKSGSMAGLESDTIGGFNSMIAEQKEKDGEAYVSTILFNDHSVVLHDRVPLSQIGVMTKAEYRVGGSTALVDAVGDAIHHMGNVHKYAREEDRPAHTLFVIITDGMENASHHYSADEVRAKIRRQQDRYGWEFIFLGANMDAVETARHYGIDEMHSATFSNTGRGQRANYDGLSKCMSRVRMGAVPDREWKKGIEEEYERSSKK